MKILTICAMMMGVIALSTPAKAESWLQVVPGDKQAPALFVDMDSYDNFSKKNTASFIAKYQGIDTKLRISISINSCLDLGLGNITESSLDGKTTRTGLWKTGGGKKRDQIGEFICGVTHTVNQMQGD